MPNKPQKTSNLVDSKKITSDYIASADRDISSLFRYINSSPRFYAQNDEPTLLQNDFAFWTDSDASKYYLVANFGGTQKKVELS